MKHNKNADTLLFLLSFTKFQREKNIEGTFFVSAGAQKGWELASFGTTLPQYLPDPKSKISSKVCIYIKNIKDFPQTISLKAFKIMAFKTDNKRLQNVLLDRKANMSYIGKISNCLQAG